jgi:phage tail-like protein
MDANGQTFWMWSQPRDWAALAACQLADVRHLGPGGTNEVRPLLALQAVRPAPARLPGPQRLLLAESQLAMLPLLRDHQGTSARWDAAEGKLMGFGAFAGEVPRHVPAAAGAPLDMALDADEVLWLAFDDRIEGLDLRERFAVLNLPLPLLEDGITRFTPWAVACDARGGRWALDRPNRRLAQLAGTPWPDRAEVVYAPQTFRPAPENPDAPRLELLPLQLPPELRPVGIAASPSGQLAVSAWGVDGELHLLLINATGSALTARHVLAGAEHAHALAWLDDTQVALRLADLAEVLVYALPSLSSGSPLEPAGRRYPSADAAPGRFVSGPTQPPHLPLKPVSTPGDGGIPRASRELVPLAWRAFDTVGAAHGRSVDSGSLGCTWHRVHIEALMPAGCGVLVELCASDEPGAPAADALWHPHWIGDAQAAPSDLPTDAPRGVWEATPNELPHRAGLLGCPAVPQRAGRFSVLVQRAGHQLRTLRGQHLHLRLQLRGNGRATPELAAVRVWGQRFSAVQQYLPELYRDDAVTDDNALGAATPHDFLARFSQLFEGQLAALEDQIAEARVLTHPSSTPTAWLDWLAGWTGTTFPGALPAARRRDWLRLAPQLHQQRGTLAGLRLGLDIATNGAVSRGQVLVLEDFRLRRTLVTLLGVSLDRADDPLLPGLVVSGNSIVGDTLVIGDGDDTQAQAEFLALMGLDTSDAAELATLQGVYARTAHRATVLVHEGLDTALHTLIQSIATELAPAHVLLNVRPAREPFLVGIAALVGVDSYLRAPEPPHTARIGHSAIGRGDRVIGGGALDWRLEDGVPGPSAEGTPVAVLRGPAEVPEGEFSFELDGRRSIPPAGGAIARWRFTRLS